MSKCYYTARRSVKMDKKTKELLNKDSIAKSEKLFGGKHWSQFSRGENMVTLLNCIEDNALKAEHLKNINDTYSGMYWDCFKNLLKERGFVNGYTYEFDYPNYGFPCKEEAIIFYHPTKGLVLWAESFNEKTSVNGGTLYGEIKANDKEGAKIIYEWLSSGGHLKDTDMVYETSHDVREGLFSKLDTLETGGKFLNRWINKNKFLWFVDYVEDKVKGYSYKDITRRKIEKCPKELQNIIGIGRD